MGRSRKKWVPEADTLPDGLTEMSETPQPPLPALSGPASSREKTHAKLSTAQFWTLPAISIKSHGCLDGRERIFPKDACVYCWEPPAPQ